jgi:epoxyqueuosine reductase QueG
MPSTKPHGLSSRTIKEFALGRGATDCKVADLALLHGLQTDPPDLCDGYRRAVSLAIRLSDAVLDAIDKSPTPLYERHYLTVNQQLDFLAHDVATLIQNAGGRALPLPASQILDRDNLTSSLSHKAVAVAAGMGWQGKSLLTIHPEHGPRIRLVSVLTDLPLAVDTPLKNRCGDCTACADACPVGAIRGVNTESHYETREEALRFSRCVTRVTKVNPKLPNVSTLICGVCVRACPYGHRA